MEANNSKVGDDSLNKDEWINSNITGNKILEYEYICSDSPFCKLEKEKDKAFVYNSIGDYRTENKADSPTSIQSYDSEDMYNQRFDTIIIDNKIQNTTFSSELVQKLYFYLNYNGLLIITLPFQMDDDILSNYNISWVYDHTILGLDVKEIIFFDSLLGVAYEKNILSPTKHTKAVPLDKLRKWEKELENRKKKLVKNNLINSLEEDSFKENIFKTINSYEDKIIELQKENDALRSRVLQESIEKVKISKDLYDEYNYIDNLLSEYRSLQEKYNALKRSKLGKLTLKYWEFKNRKNRG